jgi:RNA polymerase sigma factor (sigma-70 family)
MDDQDSPSTIGKKPADSAKLSLAWDKFYAHCSTIILECPSVRRLSIVDREDCVQEVMIELVRRFNERQPDSNQENLTRWIRTISRNKAVDIVRRRYRKPEVSFDDGAGQGIRDRNSSGVLPEEQRGEQISLVWESLLSLDHKVPVTSYLIFYLHTMEGWKIPEIAELFQISADQVRARSHRVKKKFGSILETKERESGKSGPPVPPTQSELRDRPPENQE